MGSSLSYTHCIKNLVNPLYSAKSFNGRLWSKAFSGCVKVMTIDTITTLMSMMKILATLKAIYASEKSLTLDFQLRAWRKGQAYSSTTHA